MNQVIWESWKSIIENWKGVNLVFDREGRKMKKKIIFLDIDGVLNSKAYFESIKENEIPAAMKLANFM